MKRHKACPLSPQRVPIGVMQPQTKEHQDCRQPPETREKKYKMDSSPEPPKEPATLEPWFETSGLKNCERISVCWFKPLACSHLYGNSRQWIQTDRMTVFFTGTRRKKNRKEWKIEKCDPWSRVKIMFSGIWYHPPPCCLWQILDSWSWFDPD